MNKLSIGLEATNIGTFILGLTLADLYTLMGIFSFLISIISGIIVIIIKIKQASKDGVFTKEEIEDIKNELQDLEKKVEDKIEK